MPRDLLRALGIFAAATLAYIVATALSGGPRKPLPFAAAQKSKTATSYAIVTDAFPSAQATTNSAADRTDTPQDKPQRTDETVLARINGEPIRYGQIRAGIPDDLFGPVLENTVGLRLERLIRDKAIDFYLRTQSVDVPKADIDRAVNDLKENPPALGTCLCCRYGSLEDYLSANFLTLDDLRTEIRNDIGVSRHVDALWDTEYATVEKRQALLSRQRTRLDETYIKLSHIFFNAMPQSAYDGTAEQMHRRAEKKMQAARKKFKAGQTFEAVVQDSEDALTRTKGGLLGCVPMNLFGSDVEERLRKLPVGAVSEPIESPWGFHFFRREPVSDADGFATLKKEDKDRRTEALCETIMKNARIERYTY